MKLTLITLSAIGALSLGSPAFAQDQRGGRGGGGYHHGSLERTTEQLNLTPDQKAKIQPIIDQATPQIETIRREAMQKTRTNGQVRARVPAPERGPPQERAGRR